MSNWTIGSRSGNFNAVIPVCTDTGIKWVDLAELAQPSASACPANAPLDSDVVTGPDGDTLERGCLDRPRATIDRCERGSVSILVLFMGLVLFALVALVWNTGEVTTAKIEAQTAADSAAYSSVVWTSRGLNLIAATNAQIVNDASAAAVASAMGAQAIALLVQAGGRTIADVVTLVNATIAFVNASAAAAATFGAGSGLVAAALAKMVTAAIHVGQSISDLVLAFQISNDLGGLIQPFSDFEKLGEHLRALGAYQNAWLLAIPVLIDEQRKQLERYYDCDIALMHPPGHQLDQAEGPVGDTKGLIRPPLCTGDESNISIPLALRLIYDLYGKSGTNAGWYHDERLRDFKRIPVKPFPLTFHAAAGVAYAAQLLVASGNYHTLTTAWGPLEYGPYGSGGHDRWPDYTVLAIASKRTSNDNSKQMPSRPLNLMALQIFGESRDVRPVAYATAETFNGVDGFLSVFDINGRKPFQELGAIYPWRMWTDWGWQWSGRLSHTSDLFVRDAANAFEAMGFKVKAGSRAAAVH